MSNTELKMPSAGLCLIHFEMKGGELCLNKLHAFYPVFGLHKDALSQ